MISVNKKEFSGIVFRTSDYKDSATLLHLLTPNGIVSVIARGAKKYSKLHNLTQNLTHVKLITTDGKVLNTLTDGEVINSYLEIRKNNIKELIALSIFEYIQRFNEAITDFDKLFAFVIKLFDALAQTNYPNLVLALFEIKFWFLLGIQPRFNECGKCSVEGLYFSIAAGGVVCKEHFDEYSVSHELTKLIYLLYHIKIKQIDDEFFLKFEAFFKDIEKVISDYYFYYFDYTNQSKKLLLYLIK